jgi:hypothetical protein
MFVPLLRIALFEGRPTAQAVRLRLLTAAARVRAKSGHSILIPLIAPYSTVIRGWYVRPISGQHTKWTQSHPTKQKKNLFESQ